MNEIDTDTEGNNKAPIDYENIIDKEEYEVLFNWYSEWVRICRLLAVFSFSSIGFTMMCQHFSGHKVMPIHDDFRSLPANNNHWQNEDVFDYRRPRYIRIFGV